MPAYGVDSMEERFDEPKRSEGSDVGDQARFELLDAYMSDLHAGKRPDREAVLAQYPELASDIDLIESLDRFLPSGTVLDLEEDEEERELNHTTRAEESQCILPRRFGQYVLLEEIGRGGMGVVYRASQEGLDRDVAVKMILAGNLASPEHVKRFHTEAKAAARLHHSHIVHIHEVGELNGQDFFVMEYVEGESLAERIARDRPDNETAIRLLGKIARAVGHLHEKGIVHRDLKPGNILLDARGEPFVTDFGLAKFFTSESRMTATGMIAGSPSYMAPEQAFGHNEEVGPAADIYSLGAILYELLTGRPPFREENPVDTLLNVRSRAPALPRQLNPRVPRELELICLKCLAKSPSERYATAEGLAADLERYARGEALSVRPPHLGQRLWGWTRRQPALASRLGALAAFYGVFLGMDLVELSVGLPTETWVFHGKIAGLLAIWAAASIICQQFLDSQRWSFRARYVWGMLDSLLLLAVLLLADGAASPLVVGYPLLIAGSGLWFRVRFVSQITGLSLLSYGLLVVDLYCFRPELAETFDADVDRHIIFSVGLVLMGCVVAYLVHRVRALSAFYGRPMS